MAKIRGNLHGYITLLDCILANWRDSTAGFEEANSYAVTASASRTSGKPTVKKEQKSGPSV